MHLDQGRIPHPTFADLDPPGKPPGRRPTRLMGLLAAMLWMLAAGCATSESTGFKAASDRRYPAHNEPAAIGTQDERELAAAGYRLLGIVNVRQRVRHCEEDRCWDSTQERDATSAARELAASKGGELVVLSKDNQVERKEGYKAGRFPAAS